MKRLGQWLLCWLALSLVSHVVATEKNCSPGQTGNNGQHGNGPNDCSDQTDLTQKYCNGFKETEKGVSDARRCMANVNSILKKGDLQESLKALVSLERALEETEVNDIENIYDDHFVASLRRPRGPFKGLKIYANENEVISDGAVTSSKVMVQLPGELDVGVNNTIVFCMLTWPEQNGTAWGASAGLYENRLIGLSVGGKSISGLRERVNITIQLTAGINETYTPRCVFINLSTQAHSSDGCLTLWERGGSNISCCCDHLTYFGVLMVSPSIAPTDQQILTYITLIGCSLSLFALLLALLLFVTNSKVRADVSMKVHINLAVALILLNVHFLSSQAVAALSSPGLCLYIALSLHYSMLASWSWMALEGFHLYLLLVRVFNIYIRRYLLKLSLVGWGLPAVIVALVLIVDRDAYGFASMDSTNSNSTTICYIKHNTVKMVTTLGVFGLVFIFNIAMFGVTVRSIVRLRRSKEFGQIDHGRAKRDICTLLGVTALLGTAWGLIFFSYGNLTTPGLYMFCILNSLQGFFIFLWFLMSWRKIGTSAANTSSETRSTNG